MRCGTLLRPTSSTRAMTRTPSSGSWATRAFARPCTISISPGGISWIRPPPWTSLMPHGCGTKPCAPIRTPVSQSGEPVYHAEWPKAADTVIETHFLFLKTSPFSPPTCRSPILDILQVALMVDYRHQPLVRAVGSTAVDTYITSYPAALGNRLDTLQVALLRSLPNTISSYWVSNLMYVSPFAPGHTGTPGAR